MLRDQLPNIAFNVAATVAALIAGFRAGQTRREVQTGGDTTIGEQVEEVTRQLHEQSERVDRLSELILRWIGQDAREHPERRHRPPTGL